jgi:hypothetical protein
MIQFTTVCVSQYMVTAVVIFLHLLCCILSENSSVNMDMSSHTLGGRNL